MSNLFSTGRRQSDGSSFTEYQDPAGATVRTSRSSPSSSSRARATRKKTSPRPSARCGRCGTGEDPRTSRSTSTRRRSSSRPSTTRRRRRSRKATTATRIVAASAATTPSRCFRPGRLRRGRRAHGGYVPLQSGAVRDAQVELLQRDVAHRAADGKDRGSVPAVAYCRRRTT